ncbi:hypothetical protein B0O99DRAFT_593573 [Bisporella sp. PMI_857]|nr:hypothetical protein B0O99DRAFT_593573 [Bisporella sp. PMI_857]
MPLTLSYSAILSAMGTHHFHLASLFSVSDAISSSPWLILACYFILLLLLLLLLDQCLPFPPPRAHDARRIKLIKPATLVSSAPLASSSIGAFSPARPPCTPPAVPIRPLSSFITVASFITPPTATVLTGSLPCAYGIEFGSAQPSVSNDGQHRRPVLQQSAPVDVDDLVNIVAGMDISGSVIDLIDDMSGLSLGRPGEFPSTFHSSIAFGKPLNRRSRYQPARARSATEKRFEFGKAKERQDGVHPLAGKASVKVHEVYEPFFLSEKLRQTLALVAANRPSTIPVSCLKKSVSRYSKRVHFDHDHETVSEVRYYERYLSSKCGHPLAYLPRGDVKVPKPDMRVTRRWKEDRETGKKLLIRTDGLFNPPTKVGKFSM